MIAKANSSHPGTTRIFAEAALEAAKATDVPNSIVQLIYRTDHADGTALVLASPKGLFRLASNDMPWVQNQRIFTDGLVLQVREAI